MPLTKPKVTSLELEASVFALWREFLAGYFDGAAHAVGPHQPSVLFPLAELDFQQSNLTQPLNGRGITLTMTTPSRTTSYMEDVGVGVNKRQEIKRSFVTFSFWIRAGGQITDATASDKPEYEARLTADRLYALLTNSDSTLPLAEKGIMHLRPRTPQLVSRGPGATADTNFHVRLVSCPAQLRYEVLSQA